MKLLSKYGKVHLVGSYRMQTMAWNDLDFYIESSKFDSECHCNMAAELITRLVPVRFDGINHAERKMLFLGLEVIEAGERWNIDIWWKEKEEIDAAIAYENELIERMQEYPELKDAVVSMKQGLISRRLYHNAYKNTPTSVTMLRSVIAENAVDVWCRWWDELCKAVKSKKYLEIYIRCNIIVT